jgi:hypothetical protein
VNELNVVTQDMRHELNVANREIERLRENSTEESAKVD